MARFERAAVLVFALAPVAACNVLAGLDGFQKTSCDEPCADVTLPPEGSPEVGPIPDGGPGDEQPTVGAEPTDDEGTVEGDVPDAADAGDGDGGGDTGADAEGGVSVDRTWARWLMPNPAPSPDAEAGAPLPNPAHYDTSAEDLVRDLVTGLVWKNTVVTNVLTLQDATHACPTPWRLPTRIELVSILDTTRPSPPYANAAFSFIPPSQLWTSSTTASGGSWSVSFSEGYVTPPPYAQPSTVLCVQGGS